MADRQPIPPQVQLPGQDQETPLPPQPGMATWLGRGDRDPVTSPAVDWQTITAAAGAKGIHAGSRESLLQLAARRTADDGRRPMSPLQYAILVTLTMLIVLMMLMAVLG